MRNSIYGINVGNIKTSDNPAQNTAALQAMSITNAPFVSIKIQKYTTIPFMVCMDF